MANQDGDKLSNSSLNKANDSTEPWNHQQK